MNIQSTSTQINSIPQLSKIVDNSRAEKLENGDNTLVQDVLSLSIQGKRLAEVKYETASPQSADIFIQNVIEVPNPNEAISPAESIYQSTSDIEITDRHMIEEKVVSPNNGIAKGTLNSGALVEVYTVGYEENEEKTFFLNPELKIMARITQTDGSSQTIHINANTVISEDSEGNLLILKGPDKYTNEMRESINGSDGNDIIINLNGADDIICGSGDDTVILFNKANNIHLGEGNNQVVSDGTHSIKNIWGGNGNNSLSNINSESCALGNGDNFIHNSVIYDLILGDGNNIIKDGGHIYQNITIGNGNNNIDIDIARSITAKDGNNQIAIREIGYDVFGIRINNSIRLGHGDNIIDAKFIGEISAGDGNNSITGIIKNLALGNGNNTIKGSDLGADCSWSFGTGNNNIIMKSMGGGTLFTGDGDNQITIGSVVSGHIGTGSGNDTIHILGDIQALNVDLSGGNNILNVEGNAIGLEYRGGDGEDRLNIKGFLANSSIFMSGGINKLNVGKFVLNCFLNYTGKTTINVEKGIFESMVNSEKLNESDIANKLAIYAEYESYLAKFSS